MIYVSFVARKLVKHTAEQKQSSFADAVRSNLGDTTWPLISRLIDYMAIVPEEELAASWKLLIERAKLVVEPTGALALSAVLSESFARVLPVHAFPRVGIIVCGGNLDLRLVPCLLAAAKGVRTPFSGVVVSPNRLLPENEGLQ